MNSRVIDHKLINTLNRATTLELFELNTVIERLLADPRRIIAVRKNMHLGQTVQFMDPRDGQMRSGKVVAMKDTKVTLHETGTRREWLMPYIAVEPPPASEPVHSDVPPTPAPAVAPRPGRNDFRCGEKVAFEDRYLQTVVGTIVRINQRTATVDPGNGQSWRVGFGLLRHVVDI